MKWILLVTPLSRPYPNRCEGSFGISANRWCFSKQPLVFLPTTIYVTSP